MTRRLLEESLERGVCVPIAVVLDAIFDAMKVTWSNNPAAGRGVAAGAGDGARTTRLDEGKAWQA